MTDFNDYWDMGVMPMDDNWADTWDEESSLDDSIWYDEELNEV